MSSYPLSAAESSVLSRGLTFCPQDNLDTFEVITDLHLFARRLLLKSLHAKVDENIDTTDWASFSMREFKALRHLTLLFQESNSLDLIDQIDLETLLSTANESTENSTTRFKKPSAKFPPLNLNPSIEIFVKQTLRDLLKLQHNRNVRSQNLTVEESQALNSLCNNTKITIKPSDKGGNVVLMNNEDYVRMCQNILDNGEWYKTIPLDSYKPPILTFTD